MTILELDGYPPIDRDTWARIVHGEPTQAEIEALDPVWRAKAVQVRERRKQFTGARK